ncbi:SDR family oxidoreductase [Sphingomonas sp.]|uniref:SDR family oxidoreductase n=1 Tax=Sphingomonas sp. TaxID=28214 RepID=UPI002DD61A13|nr:SDR family oxidoreductase [Sphingomonas sp.]
MTRHVLVTAGAAGIGRGIAQLFAERGDRVTICDVDAAALDRARADNPALGTVHADVADHAAALELVARAGLVDVLVNNAGVAGPVADIEATDPGAWARCFDVNVHGAFNMIAAVVPAMRAAGTGAIVNISTASTLTGIPRRSAYVASKWALEGMTRNLARELGPVGIRVNAIRPGFMDTERMQGIMARIAAESGRAVADVEAEALGFISMRSKIQPVEIAEMAWFLASHAGRHVTGQIIGVDGNAEWEG